MGTEIFLAIAHSLTLVPDLGRSICAQLCTLLRLLFSSSCLLIYFLGILGCCVMGVVGGLLCTGLLAMTASRWLIKVLRALQFQARGRHDYAGGDQR